MTPIDKTVFDQTEPFAVLLGRVEWKRSCFQTSLAFASAMTSLALRCFTSYCYSLITHIRAHLGREWSSSMCKCFSKLLTKIGRPSLRSSHNSRAH
ncbi:hypothetical protein CDAR_464611 [Caerostris darwini]|uniref:Uncharacterized protein n=1 Tax=Caerostris darwini TaxID=1538125 RepID=A0AAV4Q9Y0_9ARAC|nr:hypothetical protein CDAR_464611 [Caerostris darwini]